ncbi:MDR family MFS transporter [Brevibacillus fulvus]|uniref:MFS family permease n=1 Tax=Brevibacillus fulvus TaxID=1125967 RepID=A0A939BV79_9BACL|nr:MFS transporter [Brevibacillus fulvus]MBM7590386.1 MFS family permease [Brevibacillus fulvus]
MNNNFKQYHPFVYFLLLGTVLVSLASSMAVPFLAVYLASSLHLDAVTIGIILGAGPLTAMFGGFIGGTLSDLFGRKNFMILALSALGFVFVALTEVVNPVGLLLLSILQGLGSSFFGTISKALMGDLTPQHKRYRLFSTRYVAVNLGFSIGPMTGAFLGIAGSVTTFLATGILYFLYAVVLICLFRKYQVKEAKSADTEKVSLFGACQVVRNDKALLLFILGSVLLTTVFGQMSVTLSQYLAKGMESGIELFGLLMSINGITVLLTQVFITKWSERYTLFQRIVAGSLLFACGEVGFAFSNSWFSFILFMIIFTLGEILVVPAEYAQIDQITPPGMRGTYYGAQGFNELGNFLGPWAGGMILSAYGGQPMFLTMALISLVSLIFYTAGRKAHRAAQLIAKGEG